MAQECNRSVTEVCDTCQCSVCLSDVSSPPVYQCDDRTNEIRVVCKTCREKEPNIQRYNSREITAQGSNLSGSSCSLLYGVGIAAGAVAGVAIAPSLLSAAGSIVSGVAAKSVATGVRNFLVEGAMTGLVTLAGSASTVGLGVASTAAAGTVGAAFGAASIKATKVFVKEFTSQLQKGITTQAAKKGVRKRSYRRPHTRNKRSTEQNDDLSEVEVVYPLSDEDLS